MSNYLRRDDWVQDAQGNAIAAAQVFVCSQPASTGTIPPSPLQQVYADPNGTTPLTQPIVADGMGHAYYYVLPGTYTVVYASPQIQTVILPDQSVVASGTTTWNNDSTSAGTITGAVKAHTGNTLNAIYQTS